LGNLRGPGEMSCRDTIHLICWYLEGRLPKAVGTEIEAHVANCSDCHLVLEAATNTLERYFGPERPVEAETASQAA
jgi:putative zinc finger protein